MRIQVKLFATFRKHLPVDAHHGICHLEISPGTPVVEVLSQLGVPLQDPRSLVILVNGRQGHLNQVLHDGDVVSAFPAMAGG